MSDNTAIEWADATWNPVTGCREVSPGCDHCYAKTLAERFRGTPGHYFETGFDIVLRPQRLDQPLRWKRGRRIFVNSMSDLFHDQVPDSFIAMVFARMALTPPSGCASPGSSRGSGTGSRRSSGYCGRRRTAAPRPRSAARTTSGPARCLAT